LRIGIRKTQHNTGWRDLRVAPDATASWNSLHPAGVAGVIAFCKIKSNFAATKSKQYPAGSMGSPVVKLIAEYRILLTKYFPDHGS
jgi:hypothetical protein